MLDLTPEQRQLLFDKLPDAANVALAALVFGPPLLDPNSFSIVRIVLGAAIWVLVFGFSFFIAGGRKWTRRRPHS